MKKKHRVLFLRDYPFRYATLPNSCICILTIVSGLSSILQVYVLSDFVDEALTSIQSARKSIFSINSSLIPILILLLLTVGISWLAPRIIRFCQERVELLLIKNYRPKMLKKCAKLCYRHVETQESIDLISRVIKQPEKEWTKMYAAMFSLVDLLIRIVGILFVIASYVWWAALLILIFCVPIFVYSIQSGKKNYQTKRDTSQYSRKYWYLDYVLNSRECMDERKLFGYTERVNKQYADTYAEAFGIETKTQMHWAIKTKLSGGLSAIAALLIVITLIQPTIAGKISIGLFISLVNSVFLLTSQMSWGLSRNIDALVSGNEFCKDMREFWELSEESGALELPKYQKNVGKIEFSHVSFSYPESEYSVLNDVSFILKKGHRYAFVGSNGAGKTTVIKLLTGLYPNYEGNIYIDGKELRTYSKAEQKGLFSVVYQDFVRHALTLQENCELATPDRKLDKQKMKELLEKFDLMKTVKQFNKGYHAVLGKIQEGGVDLSGGQWQKLAMIRALLRPAEIQILDEPTASLDPKMESEIYDLFQHISEGHLTVLISHRLGFAKLADEILVFDKGSLYEQGNYKRLMEQKGLFYQMYEEQRSWYE